MTINFRTYKNDFSDSKYQEINDIRTAAEGSDDIFDLKEKSYFNDWGINSLDKAKELARVILMVKKAEATKTEDKDLWNNIKAEEKKDNGKPSLAYKIINFFDFEERVEQAAKRLALFFKTKDLPKTKEERQTKIKDLENQKYDLAHKQSLLNPLKKHYQKRLVELKEELEKVRFSSGGIDDLKKILNSINDDEAEVSDNGVRKKLKDIRITIGDYANPGFSTTGGLFSADSSGNLIEPAPTTNTNNKTIRELVNYANGFLDNMENLKINLDTLKEIPLEIGGDFVNERYNYKNNITGSYDDIGYNYLKVLRDVGAVNLKKAIESRSDLTGAIKAKMKRYADEILKYIDYYEVITGDLNNSPLYNTTKNKEWGPKYDLWHKNVLKIKKVSDYPYRDVPDWRMITEFMKTLFPVNLSPSGKVLSLKSYDYLDDPSSSNYLKPSKKGDIGWEGISLNGYYEKLANLPNGNKYKTIGRYALTDPQADEKIKNQVENGALIAKDKNFKAVTLIWWRIFSSLLNNLTDVNDNEFKVEYNRANQLAGEEVAVERGRDQFRYCRTIKAILKKIGLLEKDDAFDSFLLEIADNAEKGVWINPRKNLTEDKWSIRHIKNEGPYALVANKELWTGEYDYKKFGKLLDDLVRSPSARIKTLEMEIEQAEKSLEKLITEDVNYQYKIDDLYAQIAILKEMDDFEDAPLPDKENKFDKVYKLKDSQNGKWTYWELKQLRSYIDKIKKEMESDAYKSKYEAKENEIKLIEDWLNETDVKLKRENIDAWESLLNEKSGSLTEAIKQLIEDKDASDFTLEKVRDGYNKMAEKLHLNKSEANYLEEINKAIANPDDYKDQPPRKTNITPEDLKEAFKNAEDVATQELADKWGNANIKKDDIKSVIEKVLDDTKTKVKSEFISHLKATGLDNGTKLTGTDEEIWKEFLKQDPERVVKTANTHWLESDDNFNSTKGDMKIESKGTGDDEQKLDMTKYGASDDKKDGDPDKKGAVKYLWEKVTGGNYEFYKVKEDKKDEPAPKDKEKAPWYSLDSTAGKWLWFGGGSVVVIGVLVAVFWKQISDWWSGPAEEEGIGAEESEKPEEE